MIQAGLSRSGRPRALPIEGTEEYRQLIRQPRQAGVTHWTGKKFHGYLRNELDVEVGYRTVIRWLHDNNFRLKAPQPWSDRQDESLRNAFIDRLQTWLSDERSCDFIAKDRDALMVRLDTALRWVIDRVEGNQVTCAIKKER